jgi:peptide/nickel transport system permease protein
LSTVPPAIVPLQGLSLGARVRRPHLGAIGWFCALVLVGIVAAALLAPVIAPDSPNAINLLAPYQGPSSAHLLGTDGTGRDLLSRLIWGARPSLVGAALIVLLSTITGTTIAIGSAWIGGRLDAIISRLIDVGFSFPGLLLAIIAVGIFGPGLVSPVIALAIAYTPYHARLLRGAATRERSAPYITACSAQGFSSWRICWRHILPNIMPLVTVQATLAFGYALIDLAAISYLGLGVQPPTADWGSMVANGQGDVLAGHPEQSLYGGAVLVITVLAVVVLGERLNRSYAQRS